MVPRERLRQPPAGPAETPHAEDGPTADCGATEAMSDSRVPIVILGGSDRRAGPLPESAAERHALAGYKGASIRIGERPLVECIIDRIADSGHFGSIFIAGPARIYRDSSRARVIDTDGSFADNIRHSIEAVGEAHPGQPLAFISCDVLPQPGALPQVMRHYEARRPCDVWYPMIRAPRRGEALGESAWKPTYRIVPEPGRPAERTLPGHLVVVDPSALRLEFMYQLFQIAYRTRNRPIRYRRTVMLRGLLRALIGQDLLHLLALRPPTLTWTVVRAGLGAAQKLRRGTITCDELERALRRMFVTARHRRLHPRRRIHVPILDALSLALDIDTEEEARALGGRLGQLEPARGSEGASSASDSARSSR